MNAITVERELLERVLDAFPVYFPDSSIARDIRTLKAALAQPSEQPAHDALCASRYTTGHGINGEPHFADCTCAKAEQAGDVGRELTDDRIEEIAWEVYKKDRFSDTDQVWCNKHWLTTFARAVLKAADQRQAALAEPQQAEPQRAERRFVSGKQVMEHYGATKTAGDFEQQAEPVAWHSDEREKEMREAVEFMRMLKDDESLPSNIRASGAMLEARFERLTGDEFVPVDYLLERERLLHRALKAHPPEAVRLRGHGLAALTPSQAVASSECPVCGKDAPHAHSDYEIYKWVNAQASRFGYIATVAKPNTTLPSDGLVGFISARSMRRILEFMGDKAAWLNEQVYSAANPSVGVDVPVYWHPAPSPNDEAVRLLEWATAEGHHIVTRDTSSYEGEADFEYQVVRDDGLKVLGSGDTMLAALRSAFLSNHAQESEGVNDE